MPRHAQKYWLELQARKAVAVALEKDLETNEGYGYEFWELRDVESCYEQHLEDIAQQLAEAEAMQRVIQAKRAGVGIDLGFADDWNKLSKERLASEYGDRKLSLIQWQEEPFFKESGLTITDPDGWDRRNWQSSSLEPIDFSEFMRRLWRSTCHRSNGTPLWLYG